MEYLEYFLQIFGDKSVTFMVTAIGALIFLYVCYKVIEKYFSEKAVRERENNERIQKVISQAELYPVWHQQSIDIQGQYNEIIDDINEKLEKIGSRIGSLEQDTKEESIATRRYRVLRFNDEVIHKQKHTKEHYDQILDDITKYELYCQEHPDYKNNKAVLAIKNIKETYHDCVQNDDFL